MATWENILMEKDALASVIIQALQRYGNQYLQGQQSWLDTKKLYWYPAGDEEKLKVANK